MSTMSTGSSGDFDEVGSAVDVREMRDNSDPLSNLPAPQKQAITEAKTQVRCTKKL